MAGRPARKTVSVTENKYTEPKEEPIKKDETNIEGEIIQVYDRPKQQPSEKFYVDVYAEGKIIETAYIDSMVIAEQFMMKKDKEQLAKKINIVRLHETKTDKLISERRYIIKQK